MENWTRLGGRSHQLGAVTARQEVGGWFVVVVGLSKKYGEKAVLQKMLKKTYCYFI